MKKLRHGEVKWLTRGWTAKTKSKHANPGHLLPGHMCCCATLPRLRLPMASLGFLCGLAFALTLHWNCALKSQSRFPVTRFHAFTDRILSLSATFDTVDTLSPPRRKPLHHLWLRFYESHHIHHYCFHCCYPNSVLHYFHSLNKHIVLCVRPWGYSSEQSR